jgi:hypothetical protein
MDFAKFVSLLKEAALYFARTDTLGDKFEGARGIAQRQNEWRVYSLNYFRELLRNPPGPPIPIDEEEVEKEAQKLFSQAEALMAAEIEHTYVSCWHFNDVESEALWHLYCPPGAAGVCIRTTFGALDAALSSKQEIKFGRVQYIDFRKNFAGTYDRIFWKRKSLSHETEVRGVIVYRDGGSSLLGLRIPIDLQACILAVIPSPFGPTWFPDVLRETVARFGFALPIVQSELAAEPFI